jgi:MraZ protein
MDQLNGEFINTLDSKGRIPIPAKLRDKLSSDVLHLTKGQGGCVWAFTPEVWGSYVTRWMKNDSQSAENMLRIRRTLIGPMQEVEIDRTGRIQIPQSLREYAKLAKDCVVVGMLDYLEIWDKEAHGQDQQINDDSFGRVMAETRAADFFG